MKRSLGCIGISIVLLFISSCYTDNQKNEMISNGPTSNSRAETALSYLMREVKEIKWVIVDSNNAYIGFNPIPDDLDMIVRGAALAANKATDFGFHVWAIDASKYNQEWRPGKGSFLGEVTARKGKIE